MQRQGKGIDPDLFVPSAANSHGYPSSNKPSPYDDFDARAAGGWSVSSYSHGVSSAYGRPHSNQTVQDISPLAVELEHISGFTGKGKSTIHAHPTDPDGYIVCMGAAIVIGKMHASDNQELLRGHDEEINFLSLSSTGTLLASAQICSRRRPDRGAVVMVWDLSTRRELYQLMGFQQSVLQMAFSPDDHFLAAASEDCRVMLWDMRTSELVLTKSFQTPVTVLTWEPQLDEKCRRPKYTLALACSNQLLLGDLAYDIACMQYRLEVTPFQMPSVGLTRTYLCGTMTPSRSELLVGTIAGELVVFNVSAQVYRTTLPISRNGVHSLAACRATGAIYIGAGDGILKKLVGRECEWNVVGHVQLVGGITSVSLSQDGAQLFAGTSAGKMYHIVTTTLVTTELSSSHLSAVTACAFPGPSSEEFATISIDGSVRVWNLSTYQLKCMATETSAGLSLSVTKPSHADAQPPILISGWADGWIRAYDMISAQKKWHIANAHRGDVTSVACSTKYIVSGASDGGVSVWSLQTRELVLQFHEHKRAVTQVLIDIGKPHWIHSCGLDRALFIYDLKAERRIVAQQMHDGAFHSITQRLDSETEIISAGSDGRLLFWDCDMADPVQYLVDPSRLKINCVSVSPSGRYLATGGSDCELKVYDLRHMVLVASGLGHSEMVNCVCWSPDERQLVSVGSDSCVCVWNVFQEEE